MSQPNTSENAAPDLLAMVAQLQQEVAGVVSRQASSELALTEVIQSIQSSLKDLSQRLPPPNPQDIPQHNPTPSPPSPQCSGHSKIKPATPPDFSGDRMHGRAFLNTCSTYICLCPTHFSSDEQKILWAMSFMKEGRAAKWVNQIFWWEEQNGGAQKFLDWEDFQVEFRKHFFPVDSEAAAINRLEGVEYHQHTRSVEDYLDKFLELILDSGYEDKKTIVVKFRRGLRPTIQAAVATMTAN